MMDLEGNSLNRTAAANKQNNDAGKIKPDEKRTSLNSFVHVNGNLEFTKLLRYFAGR